MKFLIIVAVTIACANARAQQDASAQVLKSSYDINDDGSYRYEYETSNGIAAQEQGSLKQSSNSEYPSISVQGQSSWTSPEGEQLSIQYVADENGFQPQGIHLPVPPPTPEGILRALEYIEAHPPPEPAFNARRP